jgi:hypothetical protein
LQQASRSAGFLRLGAAAVQVMRLLEADSPFEAASVVVA